MTGAQYPPQHTTEPAADTSHGRLLITPSTHLEATGDEA
jgi:hypothetical protein